MYELMYLSEIFYVFYKVIVLKFYAFICKVKLNGTIKGSLKTRF